MEDTQNHKKIKKIAGLLKRCSSIFFITGAGVSADSGLPTYRGIGGLYNDKFTEDGIPIEMALAGEMIKERPEVTWKYLSRIEKRCREASFNAAHRTIAEMERHFKRVWVLTQNIDGFHQAAGSRNVIDIHGNMHRLVCAACGWHRTVNDYSEITIPPVCEKCGNTVRPDVVFFGELLPIDKMQLLKDELSRGFDIYFSIGTSSVFPYISRPMLEAEYMNRSTVEINPSDTIISDMVNIKLPLGAAEAMERIWKQYRLDEKSVMK